jgi:hypothetical protein
MSLCVGYDFTLPAKDWSVGDVTTFLRDWCKDWVFQLEKGDETGYLHYQGQVRLIKKRRPCEIIKKWAPLLPGVHITPTSGEAFQKRDFNYVMKADTRVDGPWSSKDEVKTMTKQLENFMKHEMYPWQKKVAEMAKPFDVRTIHIILDERDTRGKSRFAEWMEYFDHGYAIPPFTAMEDLMQCCMSISAKKCYLIDMPKGMKKDKLAGFYAGIAALKDGVMYDKRYAFKKRRIDCPNIFIFTNSIPDIDLLSADRWKILRVTNDNDLTELDIEHLIEAARFEK